ncbi:MAG: CBM96 family carbohydrate-binding protein [Planctomycetota bacterium]|jgi:hypothetical protein
MCRKLIYLVSFVVAVLSLISSAQAVEPTDDAYVRGPGNDNTNYGSSGSVTLKNSGGSSYDRKGYIRFEVAGAVSDASIELTVSTNNNGGGGTIPQTFTIEVYGLAEHLDHTWTETDITWSNAPGNDTSSSDFTADATLLGTFVVEPIPVGNVVSFSDPALVDFINSDTDNEITILLRRTAGTSSSHNVAFASKEHTSYSPPTLHTRVATQAFGPSPADEGVDVPRDVVLSWTPGIYAPAVNGHIVYLSDSFSDVNDGIGGVTQDANSYAPSPRLDLGTTYYWRVDEVNAPPDSTVHPGKVWSFTTEPVGYPVDGASITATASSMGGADFGPEKTIDGSGLDENDLHSTEPMDMWLSDNEPLGGWLQYELDKVYKLHEMWVWNSNQIFEGLFGFGLKDVTVEYSSNGTDWTVLADVSEFAQAPGTDDYAHNTTVDFDGAVAQYVRLTAASNWGGLLPQYGLSEVRFFSIPVIAREPSPDSGATDVDPDVTLSWRAGRDAATHNVSLSTDEQAVIDGTAPVVTVTDASYSSVLDLGSTYFWRVDEVNEAETPTVWQGDVWSLSTPDYLLVEGFEDYNDYPPYEVYTTWLDGYENPANGSQIGNLTPPIMETTIVHGDDQSVPFLYSNTGGATYSEATRTFAVPRDWTRYGVKTLSLYFYGTPGNTGQLYVKVNGVKVAYDGDPADIARPLWNHWSIELASLGVNLASITTLAVGVDGNGAAGTLYVDDIGSALDFAATGPSSSSILFVSSLETGHMPGDDAIKAFFERLGHAVTYIDDDANEPSTEAKAAAADLVYISESVGSGDIRDEITEIATPIIVAEPYAWDEMGLTTGTPQAVNQVPLSVNITVVGVGHPLAAGYSGDVPVFTALSGSDALIPVGTAGGGAVVIARASGETQTDADVYFVYEKGAALAAPPTDGSAQVAAEMRIGFFAASPIAEGLLSDEGYALLRAAVNYALGLAN